MNNLMMDTAGAMFVDMENMVLAGDDLGKRFEISPLMDRALTTGVPLVLRRVYGNWHYFPEYGHDFNEWAFELIQYFGKKPGKNGVDIQITVDLLEIIFMFSHITTIFLVTGDSDYCSLVRLLHKYGRRVIGIGWLHASAQTLQQHCDEFWLYDELIAPQNPDKPQKADAVENRGEESIDSDPIDHLVHLASADLGSNKPVLLSELKETMLRHDPDFNEEQYGFSKFKQFVAARLDLKLEFSKEYSNYLVYLPQNGNSAVNGRS